MHSFSEYHLFSFTFYGIICSGLTQKTILYFLSSNSSFNECVRKQNQHTIRTNQNNALRSVQVNSPCSDTYWEECLSVSRQRVTSATSFTFKKCIFNSLSDTSGDGGGGAIYYSSPSIETYTSLLVASCSFSECSALDGGALYLSTLSTFELQNSLFYKCSSTLDIYEHGGGSVWITNIQQQLSLLENDFISSTCLASGGGVLIQECSALISSSSVLLSCRFVDCTATDASPDGGGVCIWNNSQTIGISTCLFSLCNSDDDGGAIRHKLDDYEADSFPIRFCFFDKNTANSGNDIQFNILPSDAPCLYCFSPSESPRVGTYGEIYYNTDYSWLP